MKLRDRVVVGFCLSLVLVTVLFVVDMQNENARRLSVADGGGDAAAASHFHGRSDRSRDADDAQSAWNAAASFVASTLMPSVRPQQPQPARSGAPQPYPQAADGRPRPAVPDLYADDRFADLTERLSRSSELQRHRGYVLDWTAVRDVIVDDTDEDGTISNEYVVEYLEDGLR